MKELFLIFFIVQLYECINIYPDIPIPVIPKIPGLSHNKYKLIIRNENGKESIELRPGTFSKIIFQLTPNNLLPSINDGLFIFLNDTTHKLLIDDKNILSLDKEIILKPNEDLIYSTYIGLKCENNIKETAYTIPLKISYLNNSIENIQIEYNNLTVKINNDPIQINLDILMNSIPQNSYNFFKLSNELYNIEEISFKIPDNDNLIINEKFVINPFGIRNEELSENNSENHGILFEYPFKIIKDDSEFTFKLNLDKITKGTF